MAEIISIIDDEASVRDAVSQLLETQGYETAGYESANAFLSAPYSPGCIVSDIRMPETSGLDLLQSLQEAGDPRPIILLTGNGDMEVAVQSLRLGAFDFIEKPFRSNRLVESVRAALASTENALPNKIDAGELKARYESLSERQRDTMRLLIQGLSTKEIALRLGISPRTVEIHRTWVMTKMSARTVVDLVRMGMSLETN